MQRPRSLFVIATLLLATLSISVGADVLGVYRVVLRGQGVNQRGNTFRVRTAAVMTLDTEALIGRTLRERRFPDFFAAEFNRPLRDVFFQRRRAVGTIRTFDLRTGRVSRGTVEFAFTLLQTGDSVMIQGVWEIEWTGGFFRGASASGTFAGDKVR